MIDMCAALGIEPVITLTALVETDPASCCTAGDFFFFFFLSFENTCILYPSTLLALFLYG